MYRLIEDEWYDGTLFDAHTFKDEPIIYATDDDYYLKISIRKYDGSPVAYRTICELGNGFSKEDYCNSIDEIVEWIKEEIEDCLQLDYENIFYEEIPDDEIEDDDQNYSLFSRREMLGIKG